MAWNEYILKCFAWARMERNKWEHTRLIAWESKIGSHLDPKKLPKSIDSYLPLNGKQKRKSKVSDEMRALYEEELKKYEERVSRGEIEDVRLKYKKQQQ